MWCEAGFEPDAFWHQTPRLFQIAMRGARKRSRAEAENRTEQAWSTGAFTGSAQAGKLKPLEHYLKKPARRMSNREMLANMRILAQHVNRVANSA